MRKKREKALLFKSESQNSVQAVGRRTYPQMYGVYRLKNDGRPFRFDNYPVRAEKLSRAYGDIGMVALFWNREAASGFVSYLNSLKKDDPIYRERLRIISFNSQLKNKE